MLFFFHLWQWVLLCLWVDFSCYSLFPPSSFSLFVLIFVSDIHTFLKSLIVSSCLFVFKSGMPWKQAFFVRFSTRWFGFALFQGWSGPQRRVFQSSDWRIRLPTFWEPGKEERCRSQYSVCSCSPTLPALVLSVSTRGEEGLRVTTESAAGDSGLPSFHPASPSFPLQKYLLLPVPEAAWGGLCYKSGGFVCLLACFSCGQFRVELSQVWLVTTHSSALQLPKFGCCCLPSSFLCPTGVIPFIVILVGLGEKLEVFKLAF